MQRTCPNPLALVNHMIGHYIHLQYQSKLHDFAGVKVIIEEATRGDLAKALRILGIAACAAIFLVVCSLGVAIIKDGNMGSQDFLNDLKVTSNIFVRSMDRSTT